MGVRIARISEADRTVLRVDGRLRRENVGELTNELQDVDGAVVLDLGGLQSADLDGVATLLEIAAQGIELRGASSYIELLLKRKL